MTDNTFKLMEMQEMPFQNKEKGNHKNTLFESKQNLE